jgi:hypothetical protein
MAGIFGPVLVNYIREYNIAHGIAPAQAYNVTMYVMASLLVVGLICNAFIRPVSARFYMAPATNAVRASAAVGGRR